MIGTIIIEIGAPALTAFVGHVNGYFMGRKVKALDITTMFPQQDPGHLWCLCGHSMSMHDDKTGGCNYCPPVSSNDIRRMTIIETNKLIYSMTCRCVAFVGDPDRNPKPKGALEL